MFRIIGCYSIPDINSEKFPELIHDHNIAIMHNGEIETYLQLERYTRNKYDASLESYLELIAKKEKIIPAKKNVFVFVDHEIGRACISDSGLIRFEAPLAVGLKNKMEASTMYWFGESPQAYVLNHELAHIYSCVPFYGMFKEDSLLVHFDGGASKSNFSSWIFRKGKIDLLEAHYDLKWLSSLFNANALVFAIIGAKKNEQNAVPGKFMGLEAYGTYREDIETWLYANDFFSDCWKSKKVLFDSIHQNFGLSINHIDNRNKFFQDISATIHEIFIRESMKVFERLAKTTKTKYLYYAGGTALNIKLNRKILESGLFKDVFIPPCTNDSGLSIGAAVAGAIHHGQSIKQAAPYLNNYQISDYSKYSYQIEDVHEVAQKIAEGKIIALCNGNGEAGPRALGNRSIVARANSSAIAEKISQQCKGREWYRPIAPVLLQRNLKAITGVDDAPHISEYMLTEFDVLDASVNLIEGCVHVDGTSRIQVVKKRDFNPFLYDLLDVLDQKYGIIAIINTSLNAPGEPIVHTSAEAEESARKMNLDGLVLNGSLKML